MEPLPLIPVNEDPERVRLRQTAIDTAAVRIRRIVHSSFLTATPDPTFTFAATTTPPGTASIRSAWRCGRELPACRYSRNRNRG